MFGDSITQGAWIAEGTGAELSNLYQRKLDVINRGLSAAWAIPIAEKITLEQFKSNLRTIVALVRDPTSSFHQPDSRFILITPPPVDVDYAEAVKEVAKELEVPVVDCWTAITSAARDTEEGLGRFLRDGLHLTPAGYAIVTDGVRSVIEQHLPELHWNKLAQTFPHWADILLGSEFVVATETPRAG
ncbi:isoamyl acetate-hydrolyzing esterase [Microbotryomycetes sp. JL221]|nr:isoamyl acetate-hydrolyzing esterase [Microbotryomycetes sp. JL221]